ncbi:hypothetical protein FGO68_gene6467 [Halteria grandinella]|uniref:Uncharacterized protein n=1 Tax=Halteria grandinella TaxID=5974 RepID=A0A8J8NV51_HALGN|nr:hypothetical protein FGO68_gene6467 [Halteria grandinella]
MLVQKPTKSQTHIEVPIITKTPEEERAFATSSLKDSPLQVPVGATTTTKKTKTATSKSKNSTDPVPKHQSQSAVELKTEFKVPPISQKSKAVKKDKKKAHPPINIVVRKSKLNSAPKPKLQAVKSPVTAAQVKQGINSLAEESKRNCEIAKMVVLSKRKRVDDDIEEEKMTPVQQEAPVRAGNKRVKRAAEETKATPITATKHKRVPKGSTNLHAEEAQEISAPVNADCPPTLLSPELLASALEVAKTQPRKQKTPCPKALSPKVVAPHPEDDAKAEDDDCLEENTFEKAFNDLEDFKEERDEEEEQEAPPKAGVEVQLSCRPSEFLQQDPNASFKDEIVSIDRIYRSNRTGLNMVALWLKRTDKKSGRVTLRKIVKKELEDIKYLKDPASLYQAYMERLLFKPRDGFN